MNCRPQEIYTKIFRKNTNYFYGLHIAKKYMSILFTDFRPKKKQIFANPVVDRRGLRPCCDGGDNSRGRGRPGVDVGGRPVPRGGYGRPKPRGSIGRASDGRRRWRDNSAGGSRQMEVPDTARSCWLICCERKTLLNSWQIRLISSSEQARLLPSLKTTAMAESVVC